MKKTIPALSLALVVSVCAASAYGQAKGKFQIHYMDVGQGDGAVLISPLVKLCCSIMAGQGPAETSRVSREDRCHSYRSYDNQSLP
jgi:hypothetical protein